MTRNRITLTKSQKKVVELQCFSVQKRYNVDESNPVFREGGILPLPHPFLCEKTIVMTALFTLYFSTFSVLLTVFWIDDIITTQQNNFDADTLDGCLHFVCKFDRRVERTLTPGDLNNPNLERRSASDQRSVAHLHLYLENIILYRRGIS